MEISNMDSVYTITHQATFWSTNEFISREKDELSAILNQLLPVMGVAM